MVVISVNKEKIKYPTCWPEVTTGQFQRFKGIEKPDLFSGFCAMVDINFTEIAKKKQEDIEVALYQHTSFLFTTREYFRDLEPQKSLTINGRVCMIPLNLEALTIEQNMNIKQAMEGKKVLEELISYALAVFLQPIYDGGEYDPARVVALERDLVDLPIEQTFPIGFFYLSKLNGYGASGLLKWLLRLRMKRNWMTKLLGFRE